MEKRYLSWTFWFIFSSVLLVSAGFFSLMTGPADITVSRILGYLCGEGVGPEASIIRDVRLPRIILGAAVGGSLSLSGVVLQGMFRNPLVEPYTLGISGGAALAVSLAIIFKLNHALGILGLPMSGFAGSVLVVFLVYSLSYRRGIMKIQGLLLTGVMISFIASALIMLLMAVSRVEDLHGIVFWTMGSLGEGNWGVIQIAVLVSLLGLGFSYLFCFELNAFSLGEEDALHLGINIEKTKRRLFFLASILTGFSVSIVGIIGFVGLIVPQFVRMVVGKDHRIILIASFILGAFFLIFCDSLARILIAPIELPVGVITGILGGGIFIYTMTRLDKKMD